MGHINVEIPLSSGKKVISLTTPNGQEEDAKVIGALRELAEAKDMDKEAALTEQKASLMTDLNEAQQEVDALRTPIIASVVASRMKVYENLDAEKETEFYSGLPTDRLLLEEAHYAEKVPASPVTTDDKPESLKLSAEKENYI